MGALSPVERLPGASIRGRWGRLLSDADAAEYLGISRTTLRDLDVVAKRLGKRRLYDIRDLDRFVDRMNAAAEGAPVLEAADPAAAADEEARFFERRRRRGKN
jgi:hypothetical protein